MMIRYKRNDDNFGFEISSNRNLSEKQRDYPKSGNQAEEITGHHFEMIFYWKTTALSIRLERRKTKKTDTCRN